MAPTKSEKPSKGWNDKFKTIGQWLKTIGKIALGFFLFLVLKNIFDEYSSFRKNIRGGRESTNYVALKDKKNDNVGGCIFNDCKNGDGIYAWEDGTVYKGEFDEDGKKHGQGTYTWNDGAKYVGEWKDGKKHGQGTKTYSGAGKYVGEWRDAKKHGQGTNTVILDGGPELADVVGQWKEGKPYGILVCEYPNGNRYVGEWRLIEGTLYHYGRGMRTYNNGFSDIGLWIKGELDETLTKNEVTSYLEEKYPDQFKLELFK